MSEQPSSPTAKIVRQPEQRTGSRRLPSLQAAQPAPAESPTQQREGLRQAFAEELAELAQAARQQGLAAAQEETAKALAQRQKEMAAQLQDKQAELDKTLDRQAAQLAELTQSLDTQRQQMLAAMEPVAARLALAVVHRLLGHQAAHGALVAELAAQAIEEYRLTEPLRIRVSAADHARLRGLLDDEQALARFQLDPNAAVGSCLIDYGLGQLDAGLDTQLAAIRTALLGDDRVAHL